jgi:proteasome-associated ATPase
MVPSNWIRNGGGPVTEPEDAEQQDRAALDAQVEILSEEIAHLRSRLADTPNRLRSLEERLLETKGQLAQKTAQNE